MSVQESGPGGLQRAFHIVALWSLAVSQPLFEQLGVNPEFFIIRGSEAADILAIVLILIILIPALLILLEWAVSKLHPGWEQIAHAIILFLLFSYLILIPLNRMSLVPWPFALLSAFLVSGLAVAGYRRYAPIRLFVGFLIPAVFIVPGLFLMNGAISKLIVKKNVSIPRIEIQSSIPVVLVIFDELPLASILKDQFTIDEVHFPNFARLAAASAWYRNATSVSSYTSSAVPAILTGTFPKPRALPIIDDHPMNLFTVLGRTYELKVTESGERLLPKEAYLLKDREMGRWSRMKSMLLDLSLLYGHMILPQELSRRWLVPVDQTWGNFLKPDQNTPVESDDRILKFTSFVESIVPTERATLYYIHSMLPHEPWEYLPSGERAVCNLGKESGEFYLRRMECHLRQVGLVDRLLGILLDRLKATKLYDRCLLIVTADHGVSFRIGRHRRAPGINHYRDIMLVPLFIKTPYQSHSSINDLNVMTMDVLPTIADVLGVKFPWVEGISVFDPSIRNRNSKVFYSAGSQDTLKFEPLVQADPETLKVAASVIVSKDLFREK